MTDSWTTALGIFTVSLLVAHDSLGLVNGSFSDRSSFRLFITRGITYSCQRDVWKRGKRYDRAVLSIKFSAYTIGADVTAYPMFKYVATCTPALKQVSLSHTYAVMPLSTQVVCHGLHTSRLSCSHRYQVWDPTGSLCGDKWTES